MNTIPKEANIPFDNGLSRCNEKCECTPTNNPHVERDCSCDDCYLGGFHCRCEHDTCRSPYAGELDFTNRAVQYFRYCLELESDNFNFSNFSPNEWEGYR